MSSHEVKWIKTASQIVVVVDDNRPLVYMKDNEEYPTVMSYVSRDDRAGLAEYILREKEEVKDYVKEDSDIVVHSNGQIINGGQVIDTALTDLIIKFKKEDLPFEPLKKFMARISRNPSEESKKHLFMFLEARKATLTEDGCFLAYKKVTQIFVEGKPVLVDSHSKSFDNSVGKTVKMPREKVDADRNRTCSHGLHVATSCFAKDYAGGNVLITVKVDPADVVAVPYDYNNEKMRVCQYEVIAIGNINYPGSYYPWDTKALTKIQKDTDMSKPSSIDNLEGMSARTIVDLVKKMTGIVITISLKSKKRIIEKAKKLLDPDKNKEKTVVLKNMSSKEIMSTIESLTRIKIECSVKSKKTVIKRAAKILDERGISYVA